MFCFHLWRWDLCDSWSLLLPCEKEAEVHSQASLDEWIHQKLSLQFMFIFIHINSVVGIVYDYNLLCCEVWQTAQQGSLTSSHPRRKAKCQRNSYYRTEFTKYMGSSFYFLTISWETDLVLVTAFTWLLSCNSWSRHTEAMSVSRDHEQNHFRTYTQSHSKQ